MLAQWRNEGWGLGDPASITSKVPLECTKIRVFMWNFAKIFRAACPRTPSNGIVFGSGRSRGRWGGMSPQWKLSSLLSKEKNVPWGDDKTSPSVISIAKSQMFFFYWYTCSLWVAYGLRRYFPAYLVAIMTSFTNQTRTIFAAHSLLITHYSLQIQNSLIFINTKTRQQFL